MFGLSVFLQRPHRLYSSGPLQTPPDVVPQWYFLPFFAILRSIPNKLAGVTAMFGSILILFLVPWLDTSKVRSAYFRPIFKWVFWLLVVDAIVLGWVGANRPEGIYVLSGRVAMFYCFFHFLVLMPLLGKLERPLPMLAGDTRSLSASKTRKHSGYRPGSVGQGSSTNQAMPR